MRRIVKDAYAKVNLGLDVVRRLENGYHEVRMIMQTVGICDRLTMEVTEEPGICLTTSWGDLAGDEKNLAYRGAKLLMDEFGITQGVEMFLEKHIPMAAGMAGGSSDVAAAMHGVNELFDLGLSLEELQKRGVKIGADVPYCLQGGTVLAEGIGEILTKLPDVPACHLVVAKPDIDVSTKFVYENLHANSLTHHPDIDGQIEAIRQGDLKTMASKMENVLANVTEAAYPIIVEIRQLMEENGAMKAMMSGSGPTVFGLFENRDDALACAGKLRESGLVPEALTCGFYCPGE